MFVVDTNVLVYAADGDAAGHGRCRERLLVWRARPEPWYLTWSVVYEFLRVTTHPRVFRRPWSPSQSWSFIESVLAAPSLVLLTESDRHVPVLANLIREIPEAMKPRTIEIQSDRVVDGGASVAAKRQAV